MKVLIQNRDHSTHNGGDKVQVEGLIEALRGRGIEADYSHNWNEDLSSYDIVHLHHLNMGWTIHQVENCLKYNKPFIVTSIFYNEADTKDVAFICKHAKCIVTASFREQVEIKKICDANFKILPVGINSKFLRRNVFIAGRYESFKGQLKVIQACRVLGIPVVTAGSLGEQLYKDQCVSEHYGTVLGELSVDEMREQYSNTRVYVCASLHERNSTCAQEAKAMGCKLLVTTGNRANDELKPDETFNPNDFSDLAQKLEKLYSDVPINFDTLAIEYIKLYAQSI